MHYLLPLSIDLSRIPFDFSEMGSSNSIKSDIKEWISCKRNISCNQTVTAQIATAAITCASIIYLPKTVTLGCIAISAFVYNRLSKNIFRMLCLSLDAIKKQKIITYFVDPSRELTVKSLEQGLNTTKRDLERVDYDIKNSSNAAGTEELLKEQSTLLKKQDELSKNLQSLRENISFFQENEPILRKITNIFSEIDLNLTGKLSACRGFMFYSVIGTVLIKTGLLFNRVFTNSNWADQLLAQQIFGHPYLLIAAGGISVAFAVKEACTLIAHRNDEGKRRAAIYSVTQDEREALKILLKNDLPQDSA